MECTHIQVVYTKISITILSPINMIRSMDTHETKMSLLDLPIEVIHKIICIYRRNYRLCRLVSKRMISIIDRMHVEYITLDMYLLEPKEDFHRNLETFAQLPGNGMYSFFGGF